MLCIGIFKLSRVYYRELISVIWFQALYIDEEDCYDLYWPVVKGRLNVHDGPHGSLTAVLSDLEVLWSEAIQTFLHIQKTDLANYRSELYPIFK